MLLNKYLTPILFLMQPLFSLNNEPGPACRDDRAIIEQIPKAELHLHLGGAYPLHYLLSIASLKQQQELQAAINKIFQGVSYHEVFSVFQIVGQIVNTEEKVENGVKALCKHLENDHVTYVEIRTNIKDLGNGKESYLQSVLRGMQQSETERFKARLLLSLQRSSTLEQAKTTVDLALKYRNQGVVGIDISGDSTKGQIETIIPELLRAKHEGLFLTLHIGESPLEQNQRQLLETLKPDRIGHAVHLSPDAWKWVKENRIPLEVCLTSSVLVKMVSSYAEHPGLRYFAEGYPIAICTDDPLIFHTTCTNELLNLFRCKSLSLEDIFEISKNSFDYTFLKTTFN